MCHLAGACITQVCGCWVAATRSSRARLPPTLLPPPLVWRPPSPSRSRSPPRLHPPQRRPTGPSGSRSTQAEVGQAKTASSDVNSFRNQNLGMVADAESSDSMAGSSSSAAEKHVDRCLDKRAQEKAPKKNHKAEREKLKRDQLNDLFVELSSMLDHDRQNSGKATVLGDAARVLQDLITQVESLRKEQSTLLTERQYVGSEKTELQDENTTFRAQIIELQNELRARIGNNGLNLSSLGVSHPIGSSCTSNLATHPTRHDIWSNASNLSTMRMVPPTNTPSPLQNQQHHSVGSGQVASRPQELQLFPGTSASSDRERSRHRSNPATSSSLANSLPGQLRLSLPPTSQEESSSSSGASGNRKERKTG